MGWPWEYKLLVVVVVVVVVVPRMVARIFSLKKIFPPKEY